MHQPDKPSKSMRYRSYFWLMNACTAAVIYAVLEPASEYLFGMTADNVLPVAIWGPFYAIVWLFLMLVPMFLIFARFMRDDYSEALWRRSAVVLGYAVAILPMVYVAAAWIVYLGLGRPVKVPAVMRWATVKVEWGEAILYTWTGYMMVFVVIFQFLRWRDSR